MPANVYEIHYPWGVKDGFCAVRKRGSTLEAVDCPRLSYRRALHDFRQRDHRATCFWARIATVGLRHT